MPRRRSSPVWRLPSDELRRLVSESTSYSAILRFFGLRNAGGNVVTLRRRLRDEGIDFSHLNTGRGWKAGRRVPRECVPLSLLLVKASEAHRGNLKQRLIREGVMEAMCSVCRQGPVWNGRPLVMVLDHKNGVPDDCRPENLRMVCPNCNSQLPTFAGRKHRRTRNCSRCGRQTKRGSRTGLCHPCVSRMNAKVKNRPSKVDVLSEVNQVGYEAVGRKYGVTGNAVRKWLKAGFSSQMDLRPSWFPALTAPA